MAKLNDEFLEEQENLMDEFDTERAMLIEQHMQEMNDLQVDCFELVLFSALCHKTFSAFKKEKDFFVSRTSCLPWNRTIVREKMKPSPIFTA